MNFHLDLRPAVSPFPITYGQKILLNGSCFAENIGDLLQEGGFDAVCNPSGIVFNPASMARTLNDVFTQKIYSVADLISHDNKWLSLHHHGSFSATEKDIALALINERIAAAHAQLAQADWLILTFGTAWSYVHKETNEVVANCHKIPQSQFSKKLLSVEELLPAYVSLFEQLKTAYPKLKILLTISPVKYLRWGTFENNLGKSVLFLLVNALLEKFEYCRYFLAYELVQDDLRDYRFYKEDMAHPNAQAIQYVWEKFCHTYMNDETRNTLKEVQHYRQLSRHLVKSGDTKSHEEKVARIKEELKKKFPLLNL